MNPYDAQVAAMLQQISAKEAELQGAINSRNVNYQREQDWARAGQFDSPQYREASAAYNAAVLLVQKLERDLVLLREELDNLRKLQQKFNEAMTTAIAQGMSPEAAAIKATGDMERTRIFNNVIKFVLIGLGIAAVVYGIVVFRRWKRKK